jgi:hypothetical protein
VKKVSTWLCTRVINLEIRNIANGDKPVVVELDCSVLIGAIKGKNLDRSPLAHLIAEIRDIANGNRRSSFVKVERSQNRVSHCLTNFTRTEARTAV